MTTLCRGSPPHVRGKGSRPVPAPHSTGITPACAGKSLPAFLREWAKKDHPRMCGEKLRPYCLRQLVPGSPPHVRGKGVVPEVQRTLCGITPACAGKRVPKSAFICAITGITPACAGKRLKRSRSIVPHAAIVPLFPSVCNKPAGSDGSPAGHDAPPFLPIENAVPASPAYNLRSL